MVLDFDLVMQSFNLGCVSSKLTVAVSADNDLDRSFIHTPWRGPSGPLFANSDVQGKKILDNTTQTL